MIQEEDAELQGDIDDQNDLGVTSQSLWDTLSVALLMSVLLSFGLSAVADTSAMVGFIEAIWRLLLPSTTLHLCELISLSLSR